MHWMEGRSSKKGSGNGIGNCEAFGKCELIRLECEHRDPVVSSPPSPSTSPLAYFKVHRGGSPFYEITSGVVVPYLYQHLHSGTGLASIYPVPFAPSRLLQVTGIGGGVGGLERPSRGGCG